MNRSIIKTIAAMLLIAAGFYSCKSKKVKGKEINEQIETAQEPDSILHGEVVLTQKQLEGIGIELDTVEHKDLSGSVMTNGYIVLPPQQKADVSTFIGGVVKSINVIPGDYVKKGQMLALLESPDYIQLQEDFLKAESKLTYEEKDYERQKEMLGANATSSKIYQQTLNDFTSAQALVLSLENKLRLLNISVKDLENGKMVSDIPLLSPINGYVQKVNANVGKFIGPTNAMFEVINNSILFIDLQVFQQDIEKVKLGQKIYFTLPGYPGQPQQYLATIYAIDEAFDSSTKSVTVHARMHQQAKTKLLPGTYINGYIQTGRHYEDALPDAAVYKQGEIENVFILRQTKTVGKNKEYYFLPVEVRTGISEGGYTSVTFLEKLPPNVKIVTKGTYYLVSEAKNSGENLDQD
ncbi:MAG: efflux RND transporter periplasmic adaptor subunit [Bacteroidota bacterium]|nr:efflux RND transporter periplasmic adaptor subunit [Bacteroidota bacterium]